MAMSEVPFTHPRYHSLLLRNRIVAGVENGITSIHGLIAHGRGEAFDYLLKERTHDFSTKAICAATASLLTAKYPVISMNGNTTALVAEESVALAKEIGCPLEINIFHSSQEREIKMKNALIEAGATNVLLPEVEFYLKHIDSNRRFVNSHGIYRSDCIFVPLEDGDRCEALRKGGAEVIVVDLNPLSRTAQTASYSIVDNVIRVIPLLIQNIKEMRKYGVQELTSIKNEYNNNAILKEAEMAIRNG
jgi:4-phosphopantoate---beta-alanine ligase